LLSFLILKNTTEDLNGIVLVVAEIIFPFEWHQKLINNFQLLIKNLFASKIKNLKRLSRRNKQRRQIIRLKWHSISKNIRKSNKIKDTQMNAYLKVMILKIYSYQPSRLILTRKHSNNCTTQISSISLNLYGTHLSINLSQ